MGFCAAANTANPRKTDHHDQSGCEGEACCQDRILRKTAPTSAKGARRSIGQLRLRDTKRPPQQFGPQDFCGRACDPGRFRREHNDGAEVVRHQIQIVHGRDDGDAAFVEFAQQGNQFDLPSDIEVLRGLVEQHQLRLLRQSNGNFHSLTFAAGERGIDAMTEPDDIHRFHRALYRFMIQCGAGSNKGRYGTRPCATISSTLKLKGISSS